MSADPFYDFMCRHLSIREWELYLMKEEYTILQACGGVTPDDQARLRAGLAGYARPAVKEEPALVSLKSVLLEIISQEQTNNINKICRHVRPLLDREGIPTFCRHHAAHVRSDDVHRVRAVIERDGMAVNGADTSL